MTCGNAPDHPGVTAATPGASLVFTAVAEAVPHAYTSLVPSADGCFRGRDDRVGPAVAGRSQRVSGRAGERVRRCRARCRADAGEPLVRPLPVLAAGRRRPAQHDLPGPGRERLPELPAGPRLPGL